VTRRRPGPMYPPRPRRRTLEEGILSVASSLIRIAPSMIRRGIAAAAVAFLLAVVPMPLPVLGASAARAAEAAAALPDDARLAPVRAALQATLDQARRDGLPDGPIVGKVREGLAKGASPEAIRAAALRLAASLGAADRFLKTHRRPAAVPELVRAVADAQAAGVDMEAAAAMTSSVAADAVLARAIDVLTDLALRGYPGRRAALVVGEVAGHDPSALGRVVTGVEEIRSQRTISRADALEALGRNISAGGGSVDAAIARALEDGDRAGNASPGKSGQAPGQQGNAGAAKMKKPKK